MSLGGVRGLGGPFLRRLPHLALFKAGTARQAVVRFRQHPAGAGADYLTIKELISHCDSKNCTIVTNAIDRIVVSQKIIQIIPFP